MAQPGGAARSTYNLGRRRAKSETDGSPDRVNQSFKLGKGGTPRGSAMGVVAPKELTLPRPSKTQGVPPKLNN
jgi:hypothetical protein